MHGWTIIDLKHTHTQNATNLLREHDPPYTFGMLLIVFGTFFMTFCLTIGQFVDSDFCSSGKIRENVAARGKRIESKRQRKIVFFDLLLIFFVFQSK